MSQRLIAGAALAFVALTLTGCGSGSDGKQIPPIGSFYADKSLIKEHSLAGWRMVTDQTGITEGKHITIMGTDDGATFWNVRGMWTDKDNGEFVAHFDHRGDAYHNLQGTLSDDGIAWNASMTQTINSTSWEVVQKPNVKLMESKLTVNAKPGGLYKDETKYVDGTFQGIRMIADNYWPNITIMGTDDGTHFWKVEGHWDATPGQFVVDFSPMDGPKNVTGKPDGNVLLWGDGAAWPKMNATSDHIAEVAKLVQV